MRSAERGGVPDPFGTADLRAVVLRTWAASPARFREDANAEERLAVGYGGRVLAELAANGADAARAAGVAGEIAIAVVGRELRVANTGAPLDTAGVAALAALRASAKRDDDGVGHFGVGFTAVRALTDDPVIVSATGGVRFSAADTARALAGLGVPALDEEVRRRGGQVPALRLPWPLPPSGRGTDAAPPPGFTSEVRLPLRPEVDAGALGAGLTVETAMDLLWALPDLRAVTMPGYRVEREPSPDNGPDDGAADDGVADDGATHDGARDDGATDDGAADDGATDDGVTDDGADADRAGGAPLVTIVVTALATGPAGSGDRRSADSGAQRLRFRVVEAAGILPPALLADRPVEERTRDRWRLAWILALRPDGRPADAGRSVIGAPTPTGEEISLPARLVGTLPVEESRSRVAPGPLSDFLVGAAADAYVDLVLGSPAADRGDLIPATGFPLGPVDAALHDAIGERLARTAFLPGADGRTVVPGGAGMVPGLSGPGAAPIAEVLPGLLAWPDRPAQVERLRSLGVTAWAVSDVTAALAGLDRPVAFWRVVYDALAGAPAEELTDLPVPRRGGGTIIGPRGVLLPRTRPTAERAAQASPARPSAGDPADRAARMLPGLRLAVDGADHPLLRRLGAEPADASAILSSTAIGQEIGRRLDDLDDVDPDPDDLADFADLVLDLLAEGGEADPAVLAGVLLTDTDGEAWPAGSLLLPDAPLAALLADDADLPVVAGSWVADRGQGALAALGVRSGFAVRRYPAPPGPQTDLPDVETWWDEQGAAPADDSFEAVPDLDLIDPACWPAALMLLASDRRTRDALRPTATGPSYTAWWLREHAIVDGDPLGRWRTGDAAGLAGLYDELPVALAPDVSRDLGVLTSLDQAATDPAELLARWGDPARPLPAGRVAEITAVLAGALADRGALAGNGEEELPAGVRALDGAVVDAERAAVLDLPWLAQAVDPGVLVAGGADPAAVAEVLDLPMASERHRFTVPAAAGPPAELSAVPGAAACLQLAGAHDLADVAVTVVPGLAVTADGPRSPAAREARPVAWWVDGGRVWLDGSPEGVGRAVAHLTGRWADRHRLVAATRGDRVEQAEAGLG